MEEKKNKKGVAKKIVSLVLCGVLFGFSACVAFYGFGMLGKNTGLFDTRNSGDRETKYIVRNESLAKHSKEVGNVDRSGDSTIFVNSVDVPVVTTDVTKVVEEKMPSIVSIKNNYESSNFYYTTNQSSSGSGIIVGENDSELLIATNYHVISNCNSLEVTFCDNKVASANVKGTDSSMDLAVIAVSLDSLDDSTKDSITIAELGDSDALKVGEPVVAIGNSLGYGQSVTTGVVSALNREMEVEGGRNKFIQTDAAINPGNSGGALLNLKGEVIGINSNKIGGSQVEGMGYAIPMSAAKPIIEELMAKETREVVAEEDQAYLGISGYTVPAGYTQYGYPNGVYVESVYDDTGAKDAGVLPGDIIMSFDDEEITSMDQLKKLLSCYEGGTEVKIIVSRAVNGKYKKITLKVTLGYKDDIY